MDYRREPTPEFITIRFSARHKEALMRAAYEDDRPLSQWLRRKIVEKVIEEELIEDHEPRGPRGE